MNEISIEELRELFRLDEKTGRIYWLKTLSRKGASGREAGYFEKGKGYRRVGIGNRNFRTHRIVFALYYGYWSENEIDHIDGNRGNNRPTNLREADRCQNLWNQKKRKSNTSGHKGVHRYGNKWYAQLDVRKKIYRFGPFLDIRDAIAARETAAKVHHREFARSN